MTPTLLGPGVAARLTGQAVQLAVLHITREAAEVRRTDAELAAGIDTPAHCSARMASRAEEHAAGIQRRRMETAQRIAAGGE